MLDAHEDTVRADLQRYYGIDLDHAMRGAHTPQHIAALMSNLPDGSMTQRAINADAGWSLDATLLAAIYNQFRVMVWSMADKKSRGAEPQPIGPSFMTQGRKRKLPARSMSIEKLMKELNKPRVNNG